MRRCCIIIAYIICDIMGDIMLFDLLRNIRTGTQIEIWQIVVYILSSLAVIFLTMPVHEAAHAFTADRLGDRTARYQGRLSLNPFNPIDPVGAVCILLFGFGWARPVPVNPNNFKNPKGGMAITALAGPVSNIIVALVSLFLMNAARAIIAAASISLSTVVLIILLFFNYIAQINVSLAVFNLIPIPPLDGSRLLTAVLPNRAYYKLMQYERYFFIVLMALLWTGILDIPLSYLSGAVLSGLSWLARLPFSALF